MHNKHLLVFFILAFLPLTIGLSCTPCRNFANNVYQLTATLPNLQPFYTLITFLENGVYFETSNIADGQDVAQVGASIAFNVHSGYYQCSPYNTVNMTGVGYIYPSSSVAILKSSGAIAVHSYQLQFLNNDNRQCTGTLTYGFYTTGSNPFSTNNSPLATPSVATITCEYLNGRGFSIPS